MHLNLGLFRILFSWQWQLMLMAWVLMSPVKGQCAFSPPPFATRVPSYFYPMAKTVHNDASMKMNFAIKGFRTGGKTSYLSEFHDITTTNANSSLPTNNTPSMPPDIAGMSEQDVSAISEAQVLLACRSWLLRKHKIEWKEKKRRSEAASSPLNNLGYFWPDPNDLLYLREDPDPYDLNYNETYGEYYGYKRNGVRFLQSTGDTTYSGKNYYETETSEVEERASTSKNPFSANPMYPSKEFQRRSYARHKLFNNQTWKEEWYRQRWGGKVATPMKKTQKHEDRLLQGVPNDILESPSFEYMSEADILEAIRSYLNANSRKSESRKGIKSKRLLEREEFRKWSEQVKQNALNATRNSVKSVLTISNKNDALTFSPSLDTMKRIRKRRSDNSQKAFQTRMANTQSFPSTHTKITKLPRGNQKHTMQNVTDDRLNELLDKNIDDGVSPMQAILYIDMALDHNLLPSPKYIEIILKPGRLGRRRETLRRILSECFDLRGKCVPNPNAARGDCGEGSLLLFATKCGIDELGSFVLSKLNHEFMLREKLKSVMEG